MTGATRLDKPTQFARLKSAFISDLLAGGVAPSRRPAIPPIFFGNPQLVAGSANPLFIWTLSLMTDPAYPLPHRPTIDDLDPENATTDALIAMVRRHREGEAYPTPEQLLGNLPVVLRALCDHVLTGQATALDVAYRLASMIDALEGHQTPRDSPRRPH